MESGFHLFLSQTESGFQKKGDDKLQFSRCGNHRYALSQKMQGRDDNPIGTGVTK